MAWKTYLKPVFFFSTPKGRLGMSDVCLLCGILGLSFDSPFLSPFLFFYLVLLLSLCLGIYLPMVHSPDFFSPEISSILYVRGFFCMAVIVQLGNDGWWYVRLADIPIWHWCLPLCIFCFDFVLYCIYILFRSVLVFVEWQQ